MNLKEIINKTSQEQVIQRLLEIYPDQEKSKQSYVEVIEKLKNMSSLKSNDDLKLLFVDYESDYIDEGDYNESLERQLYTHVSGYSETEAQSYALEWTAWNEWLGLEIYPNCIKYYGYVDIVAHSLYEMTFCGFEEEDIDDSIKELESRVTSVNDDIKNNKTNNYQTIDELFKELGWEKTVRTEEEKKIRKQLESEIDVRNKKRFHQMLGKEI